MSKLKDFERGLLLDVIQGDRRFAHIAFHIHKHRRCNDICSWLIKNKITGPNLYLFWAYQCNKSYLELLKHVLSWVDKTDEKPVIAVKDYVL